MLFNKTIRGGIHHKSTKLFNRLRYLSTLEQVETNLILSNKLIKGQIAHKIHH